MSPASTAAPDRDSTRQIVVVVSAVLAIVGAFAGSGVLFGTPINEAAGGALAADATLIAPGTGAFQIWGLIYLGLVVYAVWQLLPSQRHAERHRRLGYLVAVSLLLNAAWILSIQFDLLWLSVPVIAALLIVLGVAFVRAVRTRASGPADVVVTDGTIGLYLGWVCVATAANITAWLQASGFQGVGIAPAAWAVVVLAVAAAVGVLLAVVGRGRIAPMLSLGWGLAWVAEARLSGDLLSSPTAVAAILATVVVVIATVALRVGARRHPSVVAAR
ncbi:hypothetical protein AX769_12650 [Frondihabitans sp. PAMC 28766]|uniref:TspO/MBR family protein n=1 Tax=Frondihabitans sp. PAMC 28766 TaxID=1795630 RepID=UPI00078CF864|nr:TspO/MBR family protein [Frondihabitans sp. PAMC 28766]AMM20835.1 hypothetical protein AX769_12650 [Frondihabitans sp. PAMC 28766]